MSSADAEEAVHSRGDEGLSGMFCGMYPSMYPSNFTVLVLVLVGQYGTHRRTVSSDCAMRGDNRTGKDYCT